MTIALRKATIVQPTAAEGGMTDVADLARHPCYSGQAASRYARIHLPVAPRCNVQCNYCSREFACASENRPGVATRILSPLEALNHLDHALQQFPQTTVVGIAGPGDPLANPEQTFGTLDLVRSAHPDLQICLATNGLALMDTMAEIRRLHIEYVTVTVNAVQAEIAADIYSWIRHRGRIYRGLQAAEILLANQQTGLVQLAQCGALIKVNTVMIPGVNDHHIRTVARKVRQVGARVLNIVPLIPLAGTPFGSLHAPTPEERHRVMQRCEVELPLVRHCRRCRADAAGPLNETLAAAVQ